MRPPLDYRGFRKRVWEESKAEEESSGIYELESPGGSGTGGAGEKRGRVRRESPKPAQRSWADEVAPTNLRVPK